MVDKGMSILVVDDFSSMRTHVKEILKQMKFKCVVEARDGLEAVDILETRKIDFIISDWNMPNSDGLTLLRYVRDHPRHKNLPFLMVTAISEKKNVIEAVAAKVSNYIIKPFNAETLEAKIRAIFGCTEPLWEK
jgi:two-component system, chemotaxis family, chemotaxis protein CheY